MQSDPSDAEHKYGSIWATSYYSQLPLINAFNQEMINLQWWLKAVMYLILIMIYAGVTAFSWIIRISDCQTKTLKKQFRSEAVRDEEVQVLIEAVTKAIQKLN